MKRATIPILIFIKSLLNTASAQDPAFAQFFSSPLNINPALTANINADWRLISNYRSQWMEQGRKSLYTTGTVSYDTKILQNKNQYIEEGNYAGLGGMLMFDRASAGVLKSTYASLNFSYNVKLIDGDVNHRVAAGFGLTYGSRNIDYSGITFEDQYTGSGFNTNLPTGESALSNMKPFVSGNAGLVYSIKSRNTNLDVGVAAFHVNRPKQSFLKDENQQLAMRKVAHANFETYINNRTFLNTNAVYQLQGKASYFSAGGAIGYYLGDENDAIINGGVWYWSNNAIIPYAGVAYKNFQFGISYDIVTSKLSQEARKPGSLELSLIIKGTTGASKGIPCPWK